MDDLSPEPEPSGALNPPIRRPPTALALSTPPAPLPARQHIFVRRRGLIEVLRAAALGLMDVADELARAVTRRINTP